MLPPQLMKILEQHRNENEAKRTSFLIGHLTSYLYNKGELRSMQPTNARLFCKQATESQRKAFSDDLSTAVSNVLDFVPLIADSRCKLRKREFDSELCSKLKQAQLDLKMRPGSSAIISKLAVKSCAVLVSAFQKLQAKTAKAEEEKRKVKVESEDRKPLKMKADAQALHDELLQYAEESLMETESSPANDDVIKPPNNDVITPSAAPVVTSHPNVDSDQSHLWQPNTDSQPPPATPTAAAADVVSKEHSPCDDVTAFDSFLDDYDSDSEEAPETKAKLQGPFDEE